MPHTDLISQSSSKQTKFRTRVAQFGDGYTQRQPDGINGKIDVWTVNWENVNDTIRDQIINVLDVVEGWDYIIWTPPDDSVEHKFRIPDGYSYTIHSGSIHSISVVLEQVFDL